MVSYAFLSYFLHKGLGLVVSLWAYLDIGLVSCIGYVILGRVIV